MSTSIHLPLFLLVLLSLLPSAQTARALDVSGILTENYDDGSEMNRRIVSEFMTTDLCRHRCT